MESYDSHITHSILCCRWLYNTQITSLPDSIGSLTALQILFDMIEIDEMRMKRNAII